MKPTEKLTPYDAAFNKCYFVNLLHGQPDLKCNDFAAAKHHFPRLSAIAEKLTDKELEYLIAKIENAL